MSTQVEFWAADGAGEFLLTSYRCKVMKAVADAACARPQLCVLAILKDTRPNIPEVILWKKPGYQSSTVSHQQEGLLNIWRKRI